jgi:bile acid:Na+ symporter, BASS family
VTLLVDLHPGLELGLLLVACCPGGNMSNIMTHLARGNTALSMSMTAMSSLLALVLLPLNFALTTAQNPAASVYLAERLQALHVDQSSIIFNLLLLLGLPLVLGMLVGNRAPQLAERIMPWFKRFSLLAFALLVIGGVLGNWRMLTSNLGLVFIIVVLHNASAIGLGWLMAKLARQRGANLRAMVIEISMHNSGLALGLIFAQFGGELHMALVAALWGTWHLVSGLLLVLFWRNQPLPVQEALPCAS